MRILVALIAVFMVSVAVAQEDRDRPDLDLDGNDLRFTDTNAKCQFRSAGASGPIYACKNPKTGKIVNIECKGSSEDENAKGIVRRRINRYARLLKPALRMSSLHPDACDISGSGRVDHALMRPKGY